MCPSKQHCHLSAVRINNLNRTHDASKIVEGSDTKIREQSRILHWKSTVWFQKRIRDNRLNNSDGRVVGKQSGIKKA